MMNSFLRAASILALVTIFLGIGTSQNSALSEKEETCSEPIYYVNVE